MKMTLHFDISARAPGSVLSPWIAVGSPWLGMTTLTFLKPRLKRVLRPMAARLDSVGVTANQVTLTSLAGSIAVGALLCANPDHPALFALLPLWLPIRMACAATDGMLAIEFGQMSRLGGVLNEAGDVLSDAALFMPLAFVAPFTVGAIVLLIVLAMLSEVAGMVGPRLGSDRRVEGPLGKADRSIILASLGLLIAIFGGLPQGTLIAAPILYAGLMLTAWNRLRFALADRREGAGAE